MIQSLKTPQMTKSSVIFTTCCKTETDTALLGAKLAPIMKKGDVIALEGPLGSGKSVLARGFIRSLCGQDTIVTSPTYNLVQVYVCSVFEVWHCDLFRLEEKDEIFEVGLDEAFENAVTIIEWPSQLGCWLPDRRLRISFKGEELDGARCIVFEGNSRWQMRLEGWLSNVESRYADKLFSV